jgi:uncharacterized protein (TIGR03083 family)
MAFMSGFPQGEGMELTRTETIHGMLDQYEGFAALVRTLGPDDWDTKTRCDGWACRDVASHVTGTIEDVVAGRPGSRTPEEEVAELHGEVPAAMADRIDAALEALRPLAAALDDDAAWAAPSGAPGLTMAQGVLTLWYDVYVHGDDIRAAVGLPPEQGPGLRGALAYLEGQLAERGWTEATVVLEGPDGELGVLELAAAGTEPCRAHGHQFVLAATGRADAGSVGLADSVNIYADA